MRLPFVVLVCVALAGCSSKKLVDVCPSGTRSGTSPHCIVTAQCIGTHAGVKLDCSGADGNCVCSENGVIGASVAFKSEFCAGGDADAFTPDESALEAANDACGWKL